MNWIGMMAVRFRSDCGRCCHARSNASWRRPSGLVLRSIFPNDDGCIGSTGLQAAGPPQSLHTRTITLLLLLVVYQCVGAERREWFTFTNCQYVATKDGDGDSFRI